ncbi:MAG: hypothetical protein AAFV26_03325 [Pseudomonadota bacterium]
MAKRTTARKAAAKTARKKKPAAARATETSVTRAPPAKKAPAKPAAKTKAPAKAKSAKRIGGRKTRTGETQQTVKALEAELAVAKARISDLEQRHADVLNRIEWVLDSLKTSLEAQPRRKSR